MQIPKVSINEYIEMHVDGLVLQLAN